MKIIYTAIVKKCPEGYFVGQIKEVPGVLSQGKTVNELIENLVDALRLFMNDRLPKTLVMYLSTGLKQRRVKKTLIAQEGIFGTAGF